MPRQPTSSPPPTGPSHVSTPVENHRAGPRPLHPVRDVIEQVVIAFILAFLVRGFGAEAFVIPTGSMAPSLMGMHKDVVCPHCGFSFTVNASEEFDQRNGSQKSNVTVRNGSCGNCRLPVPLANEPSFNGDRILVLKFLFNLPWFSSDQPRRWEVVVFHYPEEPETNYIKRLVGLPDEQLRIMHGDVLRRPLGSEEPFQLLRKPLSHIESMLQNVYDDRHRPAFENENPAWRRWTAKEPEGWTDSSASGYTSKATETWSTLRYQHLVPDPPQARSIVKNQPTDPRPRLISDFYSYNSGSEYTQAMSESISPHWVGDLAVQFQAESQSTGGALRISLVEAGIQYHCEIDLSSGMASLFRDRTPIGTPVSTVFKGSGRHQIKFANLDGRLTLWIDGTTPFGDGVLIQEGEEGYASPTSEDLEPVRIGSRGTSLTVSDLVLFRDIYYTQTPGDWDYTGLGIFRGSILSETHEFAAIGNLKPTDYAIHPDSFMMLGDNSPRSKDSRGWTLLDRNWDDGDRQAWEVPRELLIGKAFFIYWPHGKPVWPNYPLTRNFRVPFRPNIERMKWIR